MTASELRGRLILNSLPREAARETAAWPRIEPIHASWHFPATHSADRREHRHDVFHMVAVHSGRGSFLVGGTERAFGGPCLFLLDPDVPHVFSTREDTETEYHELTFAVRGQDPPRSWPELYAAVFPYPEVPAKDRTQPIALDEDSLALCGSLVKTIVRIFVGRSASSPLAAYLRALVACAAEVSAAAVGGAGADESGGAAAGDPLERAREYLELRFADRFDLAALAAVAGLSEKHLCRAFAARFGIAPFRMKRDLAMRGAERLLATTRYPIKSVAEAVGYEDLYHFSKAFRAWSGMPPGRYRDTLKAEQESL